MRSQAHYTDPRRPSRVSLLAQVMVVFLVAVALLLGGAYLTGLLPGQPRSTALPDSSSSQAFPPIAGIPCEDPIEGGLSAQTLLIIRVDGSRTTVPGGIGKRTDCRYWLYTSNSQGVIHIEAPTVGSFTLGQFFDVWLEPLDDRRIGGHEASGDQAVIAFVNREPWLGDPRSIPLDDRAIIELQLGAAALEPLEVPFPNE